VFAERALVLDQLDALAWALSATCLRGVTLDALALESVERGYALDPDMRAVLDERVAVLSNAGRFEEVLDSLDRIPESEFTPWHMGIKAYALVHLDDAEGALRYLDAPLAASWTRDWYLDVRADCFVRLGRLAEAVGDLRELLELDVTSSGYARMRRAGAYAALGEPVNARSELAAARDDETVLSDWLDTVEACIALAEGDANGATVSFQRALDASRTGRDAGDSLQMLRATAELLAHVGRAVIDPVDVLASAEAACGRWHYDVNPLVDVAADEELARALEQRASAEPGEAQLALAVVHARRLRLSQQFASAAEVYEDLHGGGFEPEATVGLADVLTALFRASIDAGDVDQTRSRWRRLAELGQPPGRFEAVAVADAHRAAGRFADAAAELEKVAPLVESPEEVLTVFQRLGESALAIGDPELAASSFSRALDAARSIERPAHAAQLHVRLAVALLAIDSVDAALEHFDAARERWHEAGAFDPSAILEREVSWLTSALASDLAVQTTALVGESAASSTDAGAERPESSHG
jgi:tetratricopeptide (TPR) repeat protein